MIWFVTTATLILAAVATWAWWRRREHQRAEQFRRASEALDRAEEPLVFVASHFWFPALGAYGEFSNVAEAMLAAFAESLPDEAERMSALVLRAKARVAVSGELEERQIAALRALFDAIAERGELDADLRDKLASGALDWVPAAVEDDDRTSLGDEQRRVIDELRRELANGSSEVVIRDVNARIDDEGMQSVYRAALLDCRGRAHLQLDRPEEAVRDFERAAKLAPDAAFETSPAQIDGD